LKRNSCAKTYQNKRNIVTADCDSSSRRPFSSGCTVDNVHNMYVQHTQLMGDGRSSGCVSVAGASSGLCYFISVSLSGYRVECKHCWNRPVAYPICRSVCVCVCVCVCQSVCLSGRKVYCGKMTDWIRMLFRAVTAVGRGMAVLDGGGDRRLDWIEQGQMTQPTVSKH